MNSNLWIKKRNVHIFTYIYNEFNKFLTNNALSSLYMHCHDILCIAWILMSIQLCSNIHPSLSIWLIWHNTFQINLHKFEIHIRYPKVCRSIQILASVKIQKSQKKIMYQRTEIKSRETFKYCGDVRKSWGCVFIEVLISQKPQKLFLMMAYICKESLTETNRVHQILYSCKVARIVLA